MDCSVVVMGISGRMGTTIAQMVLDHGLTLAGAIDRPEALDKTAHWGVPCSSDPDTVLEQAKGAVIIDFTAPAATMNTLKAALRHKNPMVIGTTGLSEAEKQELAEAAQTVPIFFSPNMSVGVNALLEVLPRLVKALGEGYDLEMVEMHHNKKKDAPSGTALRLAECLAEAREWDLDEVGCRCRDGIIGQRPTKEIGIQTLRGGDVVGVHTVYFVGEGERIEVTHHAHSRATFASGALRAACWIGSQRPGKIYTMQDLLAE